MFVVQVDMVQLFRNQPEVYAWLTHNSQAAVQAIAYVCSKVQQGSQAENACSSPVPMRVYICPVSFLGMHHSARFSNMEQQLSDTMHGAVDLAACNVHVLGTVITASQAFPAVYGTLYSCSQCRWGLSKFLATLDADCVSLLPDAISTHHALLEARAVLVLQGTHLQE
jgi:DNA replicative helicase MCM subunit Mcm2 (Cdc46/Mcm family)